MSKLTPRQYKFYQACKRLANENNPLVVSQVAREIGIPRPSLNHCKQALIFRGIMQINRFGVPEILQDIDGEEADDPDQRPPTKPTQPAQPAQAPPIERPAAPVKQEEKGPPSTESDRLLKLLRSRKDQVFTLSQLCDALDKGPSHIRELLDHLKSAGYNIYQDKDHYSLTSEDEPISSLTIQTEGNTVRFGAISDTHIGCKAERLDVLNTLYEWYKKENITTVYHGGNIIEGDSTFNVRERYVHGIDNQIANLIEKYPRIPSINTYFICGDDHEGWWQQREGISIGRHIEQGCLNAGRNDLKYLGYLEHDIKFENKAGHFVMKVMHPGGGSAYALSYTPMKIVESFSGGEKPNVLLLGHYHKLEYLPALRNVHVFQLGCTMDQTVFLRKRRISCHVGGWLIEIRQCPLTGAVEGVRSECKTFFDRGFYQDYDRY